MMNNNEHDRMKELLCRNYDITRESQRLNWINSMSDEDRTLIQRAQDEISEEEKLKLFWEVHNSGGRSIYGGRTLEVKTIYLTEDMIGFPSAERLEHRKNVRKMQK